MIFSMKSRQKKRARTLLKSARAGRGSPATRPKPVNQNIEDLSSQAYRQPQPEPVTQPRPTVQPPQAALHEPQTAARTAVKSPRSTEHDDMSNTGVFFSPRCPTTANRSRYSRSIWQNSAARRSCFASRRKNFTVREGVSPPGRTSPSGGSPTPAGAANTAARRRRPDLLLLFWSSSPPTCLLQQGAPLRSAILSRPHRRPNSPTPS